MKLCIANTDYDWYKNLSAQKNLDEVNFWFPKKETGVNLSIGEPFIFKLKKKHGHKIVGYGSFIEFKLLSLKEMWDTYEYRNGCETKDELIKRLKVYNDGVLENNHLKIYGSTIIAKPIFFSPELWIDAPSDWKDNWTTYTFYMSEDEEGERIWTQCNENAKKLITNK